MSRLTVFNPLRRSRASGTDGADSPGPSFPQAGGLSDALFGVAPEYARREAAAERRAKIAGNLITLALGILFWIAVGFCASVIVKGDEPAIGRPE